VYYHQLYVQLQKQLGHQLTIAPIENKPSLLLSSNSSNQNYGATNLSVIPKILKEPANRKESQ
jgi:hypothetical protein